MTINFIRKPEKNFLKLRDIMEEQVVGLGDDFIDEVEKVPEVFEQQPASGTKITKMNEDLWFLAFDTRS